MTEQRLEGRLVLIAGASRGLGAATARACAAAGAEYKEGPSFHALGCGVVALIRRWCVCRNRESE